MKWTQNYGCVGWATLSRTKVAEGHRLVGAAPTQFFYKDIHSCIAALIYRDDEVSDTKPSVFRFGQQATNGVVPKAVEEWGTGKRYSVFLRVEVLSRTQDKVGEREEGHEREKQVLEPCGSLQHREEKRTGCMVAVSPSIFSSDVRRRPITS